MIKLSKAYVLILVTLIIPVLACTATGAFAFSFPQGTVVAGPGLGAGGPTSFNTYMHDYTELGSGAAADAAANVYAAPSVGTSGIAMPFGPACPGIPGFGNCLPFNPFASGSAFASNPVAASQAVNSQVGRQALEDNTFATSFYTAGGSPFSGLCNACISGNSPQEFTLQFF